MGRQIEEKYIKPDIAASSCEETNLGFVRNCNNCNNNKFPTLTEDDNANLTTAASDIPNQNTFPSPLHPAIHMSSNSFNRINKIDRLEETFQKVLSAPKHYQVISKSSSYIF